MILINPTFIHCFQLLRHACMQCIAKLSILYFNPFLLLPLFTHLLKRTKIFTRKNMYTWRVYINAYSHQSIIGLPHLINVNKCGNETVFIIDYTILDWNVYFKVSKILMVFEIILLVSLTRLQLRLVCLQSPVTHRITL